MLAIAKYCPEAWMEACAKEGGFAWWYLDLRGSEGSGLVLLWGVGVPFVPARGVERSACLKVVHYEEGRASFYHLANFDGFSSLDETGSVSFEGGWIRITESHGSVLVTASIRLDGVDPFGLELVLEGAPFTSENLEFEEVSHLWAPRSVLASGTATLRHSGRETVIRGSGYLDGNAASNSLEEQGIAGWRWLRLSLPGETWLAYDLEPGNSPLVRKITGDSSESGHVDWADFRRSPFGMRAPREARLSGPGRGLHVTVEALVDDGPFYQRYLVRGVSDDGAEGLGFYEVVDVKALGRRWHGPLARMRVTHADPKANSVWLPLFSGSSKGRAARLFASWFGHRRVRSAHGVGG